MTRPACHGASEIYCVISLMFTKPRHKLININISKFRTSCAPDYYITEQPEQLQYFPILQHCIGQFEFNLFRDEPLDRQDRRLSLQ